MAVAQRGVDLQYEKEAGELLSALREEDIRNQYQARMDQYSQDEQKKRNSLEDTLRDLASQSDMRERDIAEWITEWEKKVLAIELERDAALAKLQTYEQAQKELIDQIGEINRKYITLENGIDEERYLNQNELTELQEQLALTQEEAANAKLQLNLEKLALMLEKKNFEQSFSDVQLAQMSNHDALSALEQERNEAVTNLSMAEEQLKMRVADSGASEELYLNQIHELEAMTLKLHNELAQEKENFALQRDTVEAHQRELAQLFEEARTKSESLERDLQEAHSQHREELSSLMGDLEEEKKKQYEIVQLSHMIENLEIERADAMQKLADKEEQQASLLKQMDELAVKYAQVEEEMHSNSSNSGQIAKEFHDQLERLESNVKRLEEELENEKKIGKLNFEDFNTAIAAVENERDAAVQRSQMSDEDKTSMLQSLDELRNKVITLENTLTDETSRAQNVIQSLENQLELTRANLDEMHSNLMSSEDQLSNKESKFLSQQENYQNKIQALEKELTEMQKFINEQQTEWKSMQMEILKDVQEGNSESK